MARAAELDGGEGCGLGSGLGHGGGLGRHGKLGGGVGALGAGGLGERERVGQVVDTRESQLLRGWWGEEGCELGGGLSSDDVGGLCRRVELCCCVGALVAGGLGERERVGRVVDAHE